MNSYLRRRNDVNFINSLIILSRSQHSDNTLPDISPGQIFRGAAAIVLSIV